MDKTASRLSGPILLILALPLAFLGHWGLVGQGLAIMDSDYAYMAMEAAGFLQSGVTPFYHGQAYGGVILGVLRAAWIWLYQAFLVTDKTVQAHLIFSYAITPVLMTLASWAVLRAYTSARATLIGTLVTAIGFRYWIYQFGNDFYVGYFLLGCVLLALRAPYRNPAMEMRPAKLFFGALLAGAAVYTSRAGALFVLAFFLPTDWLAPLFHRLTHPKDRTERWLLGWMIFFLALFLYLFTFSEHVGEAFGRTVKLHAEPNLSFAALFALAWLARAYWKKVERAHLKRAAVAAAGLVVGFLPEILYWASQGKTPPPGTGTPNGFGLFFELFGKIPSSLAELFTGGPGIGRVFSLLLLIAVIVAVIKRSIKDERFRAVGILGLLAALAYCRVSTYAAGPPRYLFPVFPLLIVGIGVLFDLVMQRKRFHMLGLALFALVVAGHAMHQANSRREYIRSLSQQGYNRLAAEVIQRFRQEGVELVATTTYAPSNKLSLAAEGHPYFVWQPGLAPMPATAALRAVRPGSAVRLGLLAGAGQGLPTTSSGVVTYEVGGSSFEFHRLARVQDFELYVTRPQR